MRTVTTEERRARLARRHGLAAPAEDVVKAATSMTALHSSDPVTVYLSLWARVPEFEREDLETALYEKRSLVRLVAMRRTLFVVPVEMASMLHHSSTLAHARTERNRLVKMVETAGIADDGGRWVSEVTERTFLALRKRGEAVATDLSQDVPELREKITFYKADGSVLTTVGLSTRVLFLLTTEGRAVRARPKGTWVSGLYRWAPLEDWLGGPLPETTKPEAQAQVLARWLRTFGPGTETDIKWWTGWPVTQVRSALANVGAVEVRMEQGVGYLLPDDLEHEPPTPPWVALLPSLDPTTMGWKERQWYLGPHAPLLFDSNGNAGQTVWVDGRAVGAWAQTAGGAVRWHLLEDVGADASAEIERRAGLLETWLEGKVVKARFASPLDRELASEAADAPRVDRMRRAHRSLPGLVAVVLIVSACGGSSEGTTTPVPSTADERTDTNTSESNVTETDAGVVITLTRSAFPEEVAVPSGKAVIWVNNSSAPHEVEFDTHDGSDVDMERIRLDVDGQGEVNLQAGTWAYHCTIHGSMTGALVVSG